jgi:hypothetical protein
MMFFIPDLGDRSIMSERNRLRMLIEKNGGLVTEYHECFTYQLDYLSVQLTPKHFFWGQVYSSRWIVESVKMGELQDPEDFLQYRNTDEGSKRLQF